MYTYGWVVSLWEFMSHYHITAYCTKEPILPSNTRIMRNVSSIPKSQQSIVNHCRLFLNLEYDIELFTSDFKQIRKSVWDGNPCLPMILSNVSNKPITPRPSSGAWQIWRTWLRCVWKVNEQGRRTVETP